jgi:hypothetical protein
LAPTKGRQLVPVEDEGAGLALGRGKLVVLEADQAAGHGERKAVTAGALALLKDDFTYWPLTTASYCASSSEGYGLGVRATGSQLLHDFADQVVGLPGRESVSQSRVEGVYVHSRTGWRSSCMRCAVSLSTYTTALSRASGNSKITKLSEPGDAPAPKGRT